jgi:5-methyltetrahydropteroyltriglutamate--homocysteine methyltransferase
MDDGPCQEASQVRNEFARQGKDHPASGWRLKAQTYSFEAANVRHEHEWRVWQNAKLPPGKMLMPGVVSHATNLVEHPQLVADRALRYAAIVGRENVIAGTDCGLGGRVHGDLAWAKLRVLAEGARLASKSLWP